MDFHFFNVGNLFNHFNIARIMASKDKDSFINDSWLKVVAALLTIILGMMGYFGKATLNRLDANTMAVNELRLSLVEVRGNVNKNMDDIVNHSDLIKTNIKDLKNHEGRIIKLESTKTR